MPAWDTGEIIRNHVYVRQVFSAARNGGEECLFSSEELHGKLACIYERLGFAPRTMAELGVVVKLPRNPNPVLRERWHQTTLKRTEERVKVLRLDTLVGCTEHEAVLATRAWIERFESRPGDQVIISPCIPVPDLREGVL